MLTIKYETSFKKDYKRIIKRGYDSRLLEATISILAEGKPLPREYRDHPLAGNYVGYRECHIAPDWLLIYKINDRELPSIQTFTQQNGIRLVAEQRGGEDYKSYADSNGVINLLDGKKYDGVVSKTHELLGYMEMIGAFSALGDLDTDGNGNIDTYEIFETNKGEQWYISDDGKFGIRVWNMRQVSNKYLIKAQIRNEKTGETSDSFDLEFNAQEDNITLKEENAVQEFVHNGKNAYSFKVACNC